MLPSIWIGFENFFTVHPLDAEASEEDIATSHPATSLALPGAKLGWRCVFFHLDVADLQVALGLGPGVHQNHH